MAKRSELWSASRDTVFDVAVIGGGIVGAMLYHVLAEAGRKVLLVDKGDFGGGTSQSSGMMIWGGPLYLLTLEVNPVRVFSAARDEWLRTRPDLIEPIEVRWIVQNHRWAAVRARFGLAVLWLYWFLGSGTRAKPAVQREFRETSLIREGAGTRALCFQEARLRHSDAQFVLHWILSHQARDQVSLNYCALREAEYSARDRLWHLGVGDLLTGDAAELLAGWVVNCGGCWTDEINRIAHVETPVRHAFSKGVYIGITRPPGHDSWLSFDTGENHDVLTLQPWGPISLFGPTETWTQSLDEGFRVNAGDIDFLLRHASRHLEVPIGRANIVSFRCGVRPLPVPRSSSSVEHRYPLRVSRHHRIVVDRARAWISVFGGKLTSAPIIAREVFRHLPPAKTVSSAPKQSERPPVAPRLEQFPGLAEPVPAIEWCAENAFCHRLEDYCRRRTNIAQWVPREGLGSDNANLHHLSSLSCRLHGGNRDLAEADLAAYVASAQQRFDRLLEQI